ncbi:hypothetical protein AX14_012245 [Amanita brunnescens Koide BX004]|nr:hypothetical protein AX14_012245 [Amanita brunnescens Koide BX004]
MSSADLQDDLPPPPPAYLDADFDRKVSSAIELSLNTPQPQHDAWETWNDEVFQAAQASFPPTHYPQPEKHNPYLPAQSASSHFTPAGLPYRPVEPLKINKKTVDSKPPPNWHNQWEPRHHAASVSRNTAALHYLNDQLPTHPDDHPPPAFTPHGPSFDGPPYEQIANHPWTARGPSPQRPVTLPQPPRPQQHHTPQRPISQYSSHRLMPTPISTFDPSMAYHQDSNLRLTQPPVQDHEEEESIPDFASLYKLALILYSMSSNT